jgi:hypothetical protein
MSEARLSEIPLRVYYIMVDCKEQRINGVFKSFNLITACMMLRFVGGQILFKIPPATEQH